MSLKRIGGRVGRALALSAGLLAAVSLASPGTAYARHNHGNGAGVALGIIGGMLAAGAIAAAAAPGYYPPPPAYYPYAPQGYYGPPAYSYAPSPSYYAPQSYYGRQYYGWPN